MKPYGQSNLQSFCSDNAEKVMYQQYVCPQAAYYLQIHNDLWPEEHLSVNEHGPDDPHRCQDSCSTSTPGCEACTNKDYFQCPLSGLCLHPSLQCDGHTQCPLAEDESLDVCFEKWVGAKLVSPFASLKCSSKRYPGILSLMTNNNAWS